MHGAGGGHRLARARMIDTFCVRICDFSLLQKYGRNRAVIA
jgi:hypothetical protein